MSDFTWTDLDTRAVKMAKALSADAVEKAGSGHPGSPISLAPIAYTLYQHFIKHDPADPHWEGRDRFILSGGHASLTQYVQLFFSGYNLTLDDLKSFRTMHSIATGHPEYGLTPGIEMTTGPLGQGLASAVGFSAGARYQRGLLDPDAPAGESPFDHRIWVICGEGDIEEGISAEASSFAGTQKLGDIFVIYDANHIQIEGDSHITLTADTLERYRAYGWYTDKVSFIQDDGTYKEDTEALADALHRALKVTDKPHFIQVDTLMAWPTPGKTNSESAHGAKLGEEAVAGLKKELGLDPKKTFIIDEEALAHARKVQERGLAEHARWDKTFDKWAAANPEKAKLHARLKESRLPENFEETLNTLSDSLSAGEKVATRVTSGKVINTLAKIMPELWGGSADLGGSVKTTIEGAPSFVPKGQETATWTNVSPYGRVIHFGVREFAMGAITNGILLGSYTRPFGGTFFQFFDYERPAVRLAALMSIPNLFIYSHDSVAVGEDGPTHQPIEHLTAARCIPQLDVIRPADAFETVEAYREFFKRESTHPAAMILTRQGVPTLEATAQNAREGVRRGAYIVRDSEFDPDVVLMASGSELYLALDAADILEEQGIMARVVSVPCMEWFDAQSLDYRTHILPPSIRARVSVEAGLALPWRKYIGDYGKSVSIEQFGIQGGSSENLVALGITAEHVVDAALASIEDVIADRVNM